MQVYSKPGPVEVPADFIDRCGVTRRVAEVLWRRGVRTAEEARALLYPLQTEPTPAKDIPHMEEAIAVIKGALEEGRTACVFGDYDVDGITATAVLVETFKHLGIEAAYYLPDRFREGYGISTRAVEKLAGEGVGLIITCDNGITGNEAIARAKELDLTVVVTDHHLPGPELPPAGALVNPKFLDEGHPARMLPGAVVAYHLARELAASSGAPLSGESFLDLISLAVVADAVPLRDDNRYWLAGGLPYLWGTARPGLRALFTLAGINPGRAAEEELAFQITPRLNAAGRVSHAQLALELLLCREEGKAEELAGELDRQNRQRKDFTAVIIEEAVSRVKKDTPAIVLYDRLWHEGVIGIAAGKLAEMFDRPAFLMTKKEDGAVAGSARSGSGINVFRALEQCGELLAGFGGHAEAAGFRLEEASVPELEAALNKAAREMQPEAVPAREADLHLEPGELDLFVYRELRTLAPFGVGHPPPLCFTGDLSVLSRRTFGDGQHTRLVLGRDGVSLPAIWWFNAGDTGEGPRDAFYTPGVDTYNDKESLYLNLIDLPAAETAREPVTRALEWIDRRAETLDAGHMEQLAAEFPRAAIYGEGVEFKKAVEALPESLGHRVVNRYTVAGTPQLVLAAPPPSALIMEEILALAAPSTVVLGFPLQQNTPQSFIQLMQGLLKYTINHLQGRTSIKSLAAAAGELEETATTGLQLICARASTPVHFTGDTVYILKNAGPAYGQKPNAEGLKDKLKYLLDDSNAFRNYLYRCDCTELRDTFQLLL